jgi:hypothetical protein
MRSTHFLEGLSWSQELQIIPDTAKAQTMLDRGETEFTGVRTTPNHPRHRASSTRSLWSRWDWFQRKLIEEQLLQRRLSNLYRKRSFSSTSYLAQLQWKPFNFTSKNCYQDNSLDFLLLTCLSTTGNRLQYNSLEIQRLHYLQSSGTVEPKRKRRGTKAETNLTLLLQLFIVLKSAVSYQHPVCVGSFQLPTFFSLLRISLPHC